MPPRPELDPARIVSTPLRGDVRLDEPVAGIFERAAQRWPPRAFLDSRSHPAESVTFAQFLEQARRVATALAARGVAPGDRVALLAENRPRWCVAHAGVLLAGGVAVPIDAQSTPESVAFVVADSRARLTITSDALAERAPPGALSLDRDWAALQPEPRDLPRPSGGDALLALVYTSGTTGSPKGCGITNAAMRLELHGIRAASGLGERDVILQFLPLHHVLAQVGTYLAPAELGMRVVHAVIRRPEDLRDALREDVTVVLAVPQVFHLLHARLTRSRAVRVLARLGAWTLERTSVPAGRLLGWPVRRAVGRDLSLLVSGGAALDAHVQRELLGLGFTLMQAYGLTETAGGAVADVRPRPRPGVAGRPLPGMELRIDAPDAAGVGEICLRGGLVTRGYFGRPAETAELLRGGWLRTGDLGRLDDDDRLVVVGRRKEIIVLANGKNVNPEDLEAHLERSRWIGEACVLEHEGRLHAVIVPDADAARTGGGSIRETIRFELQGLMLQRPPAERVTSFSLRREPLPRTSTRKLKRFLVDPRGDEGAARADAPEDPRLDEAVSALLRRHAGADARLLRDAHLELDLGLDSLKRMELLLDVQSRFGLRLTDEEIASATTVGALLDVLGDREPAAAAAAEASWAATLGDAGPSDLPPGIRGGRGPLAAAALVVLTLLTRALCRLLFALRVEGRERLPSAGPVIVCPNHVSFLDGFVVGSALPLSLTRRGFVLGEAAYVRRLVARPFARLAGVVPVDTGRHLRGALRAGAAGLKQGMMLLLFPEGVRSPDGRLQPVRLGAPILSAELGVPIVPTHVEGAFEAWPRGRTLPRLRRVTVVFGEPLDPGSIVPPGASAEQAHELLAAALRDALEHLSTKNVR